MGRTEKKPGTLKREGDPGKKFFRGLRRSFLLEVSINSGQWERGIIRVGPTGGVENRPPSGKGRWGQGFDSRGRSSQWKAGDWTFRKKVVENLARFSRKSFAFGRPDREGRCR
jgi:hypothetical protein